MHSHRCKKTNKNVKEDAERQKRILAAKEKILSTKRMLLSIVETMIENEVSKDWFLSNCSKLCQADYNDVVQERNLGNICGYPLCSNVIKQTLKQKYHISNVTNKVYDLTERKCFCSNECYKASNYLRQQLSPIPLYMRKEEDIQVHLLSGDNRGSIGEEILFHHKISKEEVNKVFYEEMPNLQDKLKQEVKKCADLISGLQIKEHLFEKPFMFDDEISKEQVESAAKDETVSDCKSDIDSDDSLDENLFPDYDNTSVLSNRHMPIPHKLKKSVLIPPVHTEIKTNSPVQKLSLDFVLNVFKDWMTEDSLEYLLGEKYVYGVKADHLFKAMTETEPPNSQKLSAIKNEYIRLCLKIDSLPDDDGDISVQIDSLLDDEDDTSDSFEMAIVSKSNIEISESKTKISFLKVKTENDSTQKVFKRRPKMSNEKKKHVTFASETENSKLCNEQEVEPVNKSKIKEDAEEASETIEELKEKKPSLYGGKSEAQSDKLNFPLNHDAIKEDLLPEEHLPKPKFPLVDSVSQRALRQQVLIEKLKLVYTELLPVAGLHYTDIREAVRKFIDTLSLTPTNIIFKPKEWKLISVVLFRMLTRTVLKGIHDESQLTKLCEDPLIPIAVDLREIETIVCNILCAENIINVHLQ